MFYLFTEYPISLRSSIYQAPVLRKNKNLGELLKDGINLLSELETIHQNDRLPGPGDAEMHKWKDAETKPVASPAAAGSRAFHSAAAKPITMGNRTLHHPPIIFLSDNGDASSPKEVAASLNMKPPPTQTTTSVTSSPFIDAPEAKKS